MRILLLHRLSMQQAKTVDEAKQILGDLNDQIRLAGDELQRNTVKAGQIIADAERENEQLVKTNNTLKTSIGELRIKEGQLTQRVAELTEQARLAEQDMVDAQTALSTREQDLNIRERRIIAKERQHKSSLRQQLQ